MVQILSETPKPGNDWHIHFSTRVDQIPECQDEVEDLRRAVRTAEDAGLDKPRWADLPCSPPSDIRHVTQRAIDVYMLRKKPNGQMGGIGWWQSANGYTAMALHDLWSSGRTCNYDTLSNIVRQCETNHPGLINVFNDDTLWWAMLCMHMYATNSNTWFLEKAEAIWRHVRKSVCGRGEVWFQGRDMEGAVFWTTRPGEQQINAITSGLFAELSARLALIQLSDGSEDCHRPGGNETSAQDYIEAARCSLGWILRCRYRPQQGIVLDNIMLKNNRARDWVFTYNTGVAMGVCALLYEATREEDYMVLACHMAHKGMSFTGHKGWLEDDGVLTEKRAYGRGTHDPRRNNDSVGFKAVLVRQLCTLYDVISRTECVHPRAMRVKEMIKKFVNINFQSQQDRNTNGKGRYGPWWAGPFECPTSHSQMAVLDVMAAVVLVNR